MFNVIVVLPNYRQVIPCRDYRQALDRAEFESERYPEAEVIVEPGF